MSPPVPSASPPGALFCCKCSGFAANRRRPEHPPAANAADLQPGPIRTKWRGGGSVRVQGGDRHDCLHSFPHCCGDFIKQLNSRGFRRRTAVDNSRKQPQHQRHFRNQKRRIQRSFCHIQVSPGAEGEGFLYSICSLIAECQAPRRSGAPLLMPGFTSSPPQLNVAFGEADIGLWQPDRLDSADSRPPPALKLHHST